MERAAGATSIFQHSSGHIFQIPGQERIENVGIQPRSTTEVHFLDLRPSTGLTKFVCLRTTGLRCWTHKGEPLGSRDMMTSFNVTFGRKLYLLMLPRKKLGPLCCLACMRWLCRSNRWFFWWKEPSQTLENGDEYNQTYCWWKKSQTTIWDVWTKTCKSY